VTDILEAHEQVGELASTVPELRGALEDAERDEGEDEDSND